MKNNILIMSILLFPVMSIADTEYNHAAYDDNTAIIHYTGTVTTRCTQTNDSNKTINWPNLKKDDINNHTAEAKPFGLTLTCGTGFSYSIPVRITFTSTQSVDSGTPGDNVLNTGLDGVGLKMSWSDSALPPLTLSQANLSTLNDKSGARDYGVVAQPVPIGSGATVGKFNLVVTMNIEFY